MLQRDFSFIFVLNYFVTNITHLCAKSKVALDAWKECGKPQDRPLYEAKYQAWNKVKKRVKFCAAREERQRVQHLSICSWCGELDFMQRVIM